MNYQEALSFIHGTYRFGIKLGLENIGWLMALLGNPQDRLRFVHIAGTNGKGSTAAYISQILYSSGYKVGLYTSPYLQRFNERMMVDFKEIEDQELAQLAGQVKEKAALLVAEGHAHPTEFEVVTAIAFLYFAMHQCDVVVLEVGLGGRFDATNIIKTPLLSVICTISYDHMVQLGHTLPQIASEKAGIIKEGGSVLLYPQEEEVRRVLVEVCSKRGATLHEMDFSTLQRKERSLSGQWFDFGELKDLYIRLLGAHQVQNAAMAVKATHLLSSLGLPVGTVAIMEGLSNAVWKGRLEVVQQNPVILLDGAHNPQGAKVLSEFLEEYFPDQPRVFLVGIMKDKDYEAIITRVIRKEDTAIAVKPQLDRAMEAAALSEILKKHCEDVFVSDTMNLALELALKLADSGGVICIFGSLYLIGEVRTVLLG